MIIKKTLENIKGWFRDPHNETLALCSSFVTMFTNAQKVTVEVRSKNPKEKGWRKASWVDEYAVSVCKRNFIVCREEAELMQSCGLGENQAFWVKVSPA